MHKTHVRQVALDLLNTIFPLPKGVRLLGMCLSNFQVNRYRPQVANYPLSCKLTRLKALFMFDN